jgi:uncharacterized membrane protein (DUF2068 family)
MLRNLAYAAESKKISADFGLGLRIVAPFEGIKGTIVLLTGFEILLLINQDLHQAAADILRYFHCDPSSKYPLIFLDFADHTSDANLWAMACAAVSYAAILLTEAVGLWFISPLKNSVFPHKAIEPYG